MPHRYTFFPIPDYHQWDRPKNSLYPLLFIISKIPFADEQLNAVLKCRNSCAQMFQILINFGPNTNRFVH